MLLIAHLINVLSFIHCPFLSIFTHLQYCSCFLLHACTVCLPCLVDSSLPLSGWDSQPLPATEGEHPAGPPLCHRFRVPGTNGKGGGKKVCLGGGRLSPLPPPPPPRGRVWERGSRDRAFTKGQ